MCNKLFLYNCIDDLQIFFKCILIEEKKMLNIESVYSQRIMENWNIWNRILRVLCESIEEYDFESFDSLHQYLCNFAQKILVRLLQIYIWDIKYFFFKSLQKKISELLAIINVSFFDKYCTIFVNQWEKSRNFNISFQHESKRSLKYKL